MSAVRIGRDDSKHLQHTQAAHEPFGHIHFEHEHRRTISVPPIPDLRFEHTYLRNIRQHVRVENAKLPGASDMKEKNEAQEASLGTEVVHVRWGKVLWITVKEQIVSPLVQGMLWCVRMPRVCTAVLTVTFCLCRGAIRWYLMPCAALLGLNFRAWWNRGDVLASRRRGDRQTIDSVRNWVFPKPS